MLKRVPPPRSVLPVLEKLKVAYKLWHGYHELLPKTQKYSLGNRIDKLFIESIEATATAAFLPPSEKLTWVRLALRKTDTKQVLLQVLWETRSLENKHYIALVEALTSIGRDLGGWNGQLTKNFAPAKAGAKK